MGLRLITADFSHGFVDSSWPRIPADTFGHGSPRIFPFRPRLLRISSLKASLRLFFGDCEFDPGQRLLLRHGSATPLSPKAFQLLELLLDRRPEALSKTELLESLWPKTFVSDASLHNLVAEIRAALDDDPRTPRFVRTVPRYGYAFHGDARPALSERSESKGPAPATDSKSAQPTGSGPRLVSRKREWPLAEGANVIGRDRECAVCIDSGTVSRRHAKIVVTNGQATIEDPGSKNGTTVDGRKVRKPVALEEGAQVRVGSVTMTYRTLDDLPSTLTQRRR
jgi:DNA-binding winged helix-turn-helix (wHTH) protein